MRLYYNNKLTVSIAHIEVDVHFLKGNLDNGLICSPYMPINSQLADVLIKDSDNLAFETIIGKLEMDNIYSPLDERNRKYHLVSWDKVK